MLETRPRTEAEQDTLLLEIYALSRQFAVEMVRRKQDIDDVVHEIAENCLVKLRMAEWHHEPVDFELFVRVLVWNHLIDRRRKRHVRRRYDAEHHENRAHTPPAWLSADASDTEESIRRLQDDLMAQLPFECRIAYYLARREGQTYAQIAHEFGVSKETIHNYIRYAHREFRKELRRQGYDIDSTELRQRRGRGKWKLNEAQLLARYPALQAAAAASITAG